MDVTATHFLPFHPKPVAVEKVSDWIHGIPHLVAIAFHHPVPHQEKYSHACDDQKPNSPFEVQDTGCYH